MKPGRPQQIFEKCANIRFPENTSTGSKVVLLRVDGQTEGHDEGNSRLSQFCERAQKISQSMLRREIIAVCSQIQICAGRT
jgi:hypothetical protein